MMTPIEWALAKVGRPALTAGVRKAVSYVGGKALDKWKGWRAGKRAFEGADLLEEGSFETLVAEQLGKLAENADLPLSVRSWYESIDAQAHFVEAILARASTKPQLIERADRALASSYSLRTGDSSGLAIGHIDLGVSHVYGQLTATESSNRKLQNALQMWMAGQMYSSQQVAEFPSSADLENLRVVAADLAAAARSTWKMPSFIAPLRLEALEAVDASGNPAPVKVSSDELATCVGEGRSLVLWGVGGIGKTVYLLELASRLAGENNEPVALYVDAAVWARSSQPIFGYIESHPAAQRAGLTAEALAKFAGLGHLILLVNGWNEIPAHLKVHSRELFSLLTGAFPKLAVVVASRTEQETPALDGARVVSVEGLTWSGQVEVVRAELPSQKADILLDRMGKDTNLRHSARSPLILRGLVEQSKRSAAIANTVFDLLGAVVDAFEQDPSRSERLADEPLFRRQARYLEELAFRLSLAGGTDLARDEALSILTGVHRNLVDQGLVDGPAKPELVLTALASQHLLHLQDDVVRFSHQRFQEYYAARRILELLKADLESNTLLRQIVNSPAWEETLELVAEKLKLSGVDGAKSRSRLVEVAHTLDIAYASELAGLCAFSETDNKVLFGQLIHKVELLAQADLPEVRHLASACQVATQFTEFAPAVWALVEQKRWREALPHRYGGGSWLVVQQLGPNVNKRIASWTPEHRSGFIQEVVTNPLNFEFVVDVAKSDASMEVREGAIAALLWHYPASPAALNVWTTAPQPLQARSRLLGAISSFLDEGLAVEEICEQLRSIADSAPSEQVWELLAKARPDEFGPLVVEQALAHLQEVENYSESRTLLSVAEKFAPERALALAEKRIFARRSTPQWARDLWSAQSSQAQQAFFSRAWTFLMQGEPCSIDFEFVGPLAGPRQVTESLSAWLTLQSSESTRERENDERRRSIENLVVCARSEHLVQAVLSLGAEAGYAESVALTNVLIRSCGVGAFTADDRPTWRPSPEQARQLLDLFGRRCEAPVFPHDELFVNLACLAVSASAEEFSPMAVEALARQLEAWDDFRAKIAVWSKRGISERPSNPYYGNQILLTLERCGPSALHGVLKLSTHAQAAELVPEAVARMASLPWQPKKSSWPAYLGSALQDGDDRRSKGRALLQPSDELQPVTNSAAQTMGRMVIAQLELDLAAREVQGAGTKIAPTYKLGKLTRQLAMIPSPEVLAPVLRVLRSGIIDIDSFMGTVRSLVRQGWQFSDIAVVQEFERLFDQALKSSFHGQNEFRIAEYVQLAFVVRPASLLHHSCSHYLFKWHRFSSAAAIISAMSKWAEVETLPLLIALGELEGVSSGEREGLPQAIADSISAENFSAFVELVASKRLFSYCRSSWTIEKLAEPIARVLTDAPHLRESLVQACREASIPWAQELLFRVLALVDSSEVISIRCGLELLDEGRADSTEAPAYRALMRMFIYKRPVSVNVVEVLAKSCNDLRLELYRRAGREDRPGRAAQRLLANLETRRRGADRPSDELRHPMIEDGRAWTDVLLSASVKN